MKKTLFISACTALVAPALADDVTPIVVDLFAATGSSLTSSTGVQIGGANNTGSATVNSAIAFSYTLPETLVCTLKPDTTISIAFKVAVSGGNNNRNDQGIVAQLMSAFGTSELVTYTNSGKTSTAPATLTMTLNEAAINSMIASGSAQKLILLITDTDNISGTNEAWRISSMKLSYIPESAASSLSLLTLAALSARRKRH